MALAEAGILLHVGCGPKRIDQTPFAGMAWEEQRLDIDPQAQPDVIGTITSMTDVADRSVDAVYSSHNLEHLYPHEVSFALAEFRRVLKPEGFAVITCPDLRSVAAAVANDQLTEPLYLSPSGPIAAIDVIYGHRASLASGQLAMAHRCGFTERVLVACLQEAGFSQTASLTRPEAFDLWALATCTPWPDDELHDAARRLMPVSAPDEG